MCLITLKTIQTYAVRSFLIVACYVAIPAEAQPADVRVLVDVSGSMEQADPKAVRGPATVLLATLRPDQSLGGIWLFGSDVRPLVPYGPVNVRWDALLKPIESSIGSTDRFTHMESALKTGIEAGKESKAACHVILITDGIVDVRGGREASQASRDRILKVVLPSAIKKNCRIHTIALSKQADLSLLRQISLATNGLFTLINNPGDLIPVMLDALELALRSQQLPVRDQHIQVDADIRQLRIIRLDETKKIELKSEKIAIDHEVNDPSINWYTGRGYRALIWSTPSPGRYRLNTEFGKNDRILIDSSVILDLEELPPTIASNQTLGLSANIVGATGPLTDSKREYWVTFGSGIDPVREKASSLRMQLDSPVAGRSLLTLQSFDQSHERQIQRMFEVLKQKPALELANNSAQGVGQVGSAIDGKPKTSSDTAKLYMDQPSVSQAAMEQISALSDQAKEILPENMKTWPTWQLIAIGLTLLAFLILMIGLMLRPQKKS